MDEAGWIAQPTNAQPLGSVNPSAAARMRRTQSAVDAAAELMMTISIADTRWTVKYSRVSNQSRD